jgi:hypothetical protein
MRAKKNADGTYSPNNHFHISYANISNSQKRDYVLLIFEVFFAKKKTIVHKRAGVLSGKSFKTTGHHS